MTGTEQRQRHPVPDLICAVLPLWISLGLSELALAQAIPEPPRLFFGQIYNPAGGPFSRVTTGTLTWTFQPVPNGPAVVASAPCTNSYAPYGFLIEVPSESAMPGLLTSSNVLSLNSPAPTYYRASVQLNGQPIYLKYPTQELFSISRTNRGQMEQVDLTLLQSDQDSDGNGLPDGWEMQHFGHLGVDPNAETYQNGMSYLAAYLAGTDPNDPSSTFRLLGASPGPNGSRTVSWTSAESRTYTLLRSTNLQSGFQAVASGIPSAGAVTRYQDIVPDGVPACFYQVTLP